jgi:acetyltransferase-like isoleucine patch superfamily enzyme
MLKGLKDTGKHLWFILTYPKIGPDMYFTHWLLFFKPLRLLFQKYKVGNIGHNSEIRPYCTIIGTKNISIGNNVTIPPGTMLIANPDLPEVKIIIEDDVLFGPNNAVYCSTHLFANPHIPIQNQGYSGKTTLIKSGSWIGINAVIMPGITIGKNAVVGANSVVTHDVPDYAVVAGVPARILKFTNETNHDSDK